VTNACPYVAFFQRAAARPGGVRSSAPLGRVLEITGAPKAPYRRPRRPRRLAEGGAVRNLSRRLSIGGRPAAQSLNSRWRFITDAFDGALVERLDDLKAGVKIDYPTASQRTDVTLRKAVTVAVPVPASVSLFDAAPEDDPFEAGLSLWRPRTTKRERPAMHARRPSHGRPRCLGALNALLLLRIGSVVMCHQALSAPRLFGSSSHRRIPN
jgi:hypothetical protein